MSQACLFDKKLSKWAKLMYFIKNRINKNKAYLLIEKLRFKLVN